MLKKQNWLITDELDRFLTYCQRIKYKIDRPTSLPVR